MPSLAVRPTLQIKGFNPYANAVLKGDAPHRVSTAAYRPSPPPALQQAESGFGISSTRPYGTDSYQPSSTRTQIDAHNVTYRIFDHLKLEVPYAHVELEDRTPEDPMHLEGLDFNLHLRSGQLRVNDVGVSLTVGDLLKQNNVPLNDVRVTFDPRNEINVEGKFKALGVGIPVKVSGTVGATARGEISYSLGRVSVMGIPVNGLMNVLGLSLEKTLKLNDPSKGYYAVGNDVFINPNQLLEQPGVNVRVADVSTHVGDLVLTFGDNPALVGDALAKVERDDLNSIELRGGHFYYDGYFVKDGKVRMEDKTPHTPLEMEKDGETLLNLSRGFVGVSEYKFAGMIRDKLGTDGALKYPVTYLRHDTAELQGLMWNTVPLKLDLTFDRTDTGKLMFTPGNAKAFGFVPLPDSLIRKQVNGMVDGGVPYGNGVMLPSLGDTHLGYLRQVQHQAGYLVLQAGDPYRN